MNERPNGRFTADAMAEAMRAIADRLGLDSHDAQLLRLTNNAVFALPTAGVVIRVTRSHYLLDRATKVAKLGAWFADVHAPTIRLADVDQPVLHNGVAATIWHYLPPTGPQPTVEDLGTVLRRFHQLGTPSIVLPGWDPIGDAQRRIADAEHLPHHQRDTLLRWCRRLTPHVQAVRDRAGAGLIHGDAHAGNLLRRSNGDVVLCDFDATCLGPWQVDLVAVAVGETRFGRPGVHRRLADAYGYDVTTDPLWPVLREARELKMVAAAVPLLASTPGIADEFALRLTSATQRTDERWTPFANLHS